jgi:outer membrane protein assembly factor BamD
MAPSPISPATRIKRHGLALGIGLLALTLTACGAGMREFLGLDAAESAESIVDLDTYHDPLVLIKRADRLFEKRNYLEAAMTYERFLELHAIHRQADYAQYRMGVSYLKLFRSIDRDPEPMTKANKAFTKFLDRYPDSLYTAEARGQLALVRKHLADYELYVGRFYLRQHAYEAAIGRLEGLLQSYNDLPVVDEALYLLGRAYGAAGRVDDAKERLQRLLEHYPGSSYQERAQEQLARFNGHDA